MSARSPRRLRDLPSQLGSAKVKLGIRNTTDAAFLGIVRCSVQQMEDNPNFPDPMPTQDLMAEAVEALAQAMADADSARSAAIAATSRKDTLRAQLEQLYGLRGNYVAMVSGGNPNMIMSGGMRVRKDPSPIGELDMPSGLVCDLNGNAGMMILTWDVVTNAQTYLVQMAAITPEMDSADFPWVSLNPCSTRKLTITELTLGQRYAFRVAAVGGKTGQGYWSPPVMRTAG
jgi:hypothetical protein